MPLSTDPLLNIVPEYLRSSYFILPCILTMPGFYNTYPLSLSAIHGAFVPPPSSYVEL